MVLGMAFFPLVQAAVVAKDTSSWAFTGHEIAAFLIGLFPLIFLLFMLLFPTYMIIRSRH